MANDALNLARANEVNIKNNNDNLLIKIDKLEEQLEDQTNHSMRTSDEMLKLVMQGKNVKM